MKTSSAPVYDYTKPSARCPFCKGKLFDTRWADGEKQQRPRPHCTGRIIFGSEQWSSQKRTIYDEWWAGNWKPEVYAGNRIRLVWAGGV